MLGDLHRFFGVARQQSRSRGDRSQRTSEIVSEHRDELLPQFGGLLVARQFFLMSQLALGDVYGGSDHPLASPGLVEHAPALGGDPADKLVLLANRAIFHIVKRAARRVGGGGIGGGDAVAVVRVQPVVKIVEADGSVGRNAEHRLDANRPSQLAVAFLDIPPADFGGFRGQPQSFLHRLQFGWGERAVVGRQFG